MSSYGREAPDCHPIQFSRLLTFTVGRNRPQGDVDGRLLSGNLIKVCGPSVRALSRVVRLGSHFDIMPKRSGLGLRGFLISRLVMTARKRAQRVNTDER